MKLFLFKVFFFISLMGYSQIGLNFEETQLKFGNDNVSKSIINEIHFEVKKLSDTETIKFSYNGEDIVDMIEVEDAESINEDRFHKLVQELNPNFMFTSTDNTENLIFYYDSKNQFLNIKVYKTSEKTELNKIIFISDPQTISELIPNIKKWK